METSLDLDERPRRRSLFTRLTPAQAVALGFLGVIAIGTVVLCLPMSTTSGETTDFLPAMFTVTSAVTVTGLAVMDTGTHWSGLGQATVLTLIQIGGFGIMSVSSLAGMLLTGRIGLRSRRYNQAENRTLGTGDVARTVIAALAITVICEFVVALVTAIRFATFYDMPALRAAWEGLFHAISAFNNAGFGLRSDSLVPYVGDGWIILPLACALIIGGLGYPVVAEMWDKLRFRLTHGNLGHPRKFSVSTKITLVGTAMLIAAGVLVVGALEWNNTLAGQPLGTKLLGAFFQGVTPRTAGFNSVDFGEVQPVTLMATGLLMFIGGGSAGTAGGIKITTAAVLLAAIIAEIRGHNQVTIAHRTIIPSVVRQALTVASISVVLVVSCVVFIRLLEPGFSGEAITFEVISAFATVGLSTGITADLSAPSQIVLCFLMYIGRIGPVTLVVALAAQHSARRFEYPEERPFIG